MNVTTFLQTQSAEYHRHTSHATKLKAILEQLTAKHGDVQNHPKRIPAKTAQSEQHLSR